MYMYVHICLYVYMDMFSAVVVYDLAGDEFAPHICPSLTTKLSLEFSVTT